MTTITTHFGRLCVGTLTGLLVSLACFQNASAADLPSFDSVSKDYVKVPVTDQSAKKGLFALWKRTKDSQLLAELPKNFATKRYFIALTVSSGDRYAGLQSGDWVVSWRRYGDRLALIAPNLSVRATGDAESRASVKRLFTDRVLLDVPILAMGPTGGPVVDMDALLVSGVNASRFFGPSVRVSNSRIKSLESAKVFKSNIEIAFQIVGANDKLQTLHYSFSEVPSSKGGFKPRKADERVGYFTTTFSDLSKYKDDETTVRYINRWHLEKRDPSLELSPPKNPIRFYIEHTAPVRYRRWIKAGVEYWNKAFEKVGIVDAVVVEYQDAQSGAHMEKDPEDVRHNFIRWLNNDIGTAIGPSRVHPETGQILDADIILTDGWIRHFRFNYEDLLPKLAMENFAPETLSWLSENPQWDPRIRMAPPEYAANLSNRFRREAQLPDAGFKMAQADPTLLGDDEYDGLYGLISQKNGYCNAATSRSLDLALARMNWGLALLGDDDEEEDEKDDDSEDKKEADDADEKDGREDQDDKEKDDDKDGEKKSDDKDDKEDEDDDKEEDKEKSAKDKQKAKLIDGMPEWFVGPLLADLVAHEVGHTLGLRHNFKASGLYDLDEVNSNNVKGTKTIAASVMDYIPINYRLEAGQVQGDYGMIDIGPYDFWAIEYGYTFDSKSLPKILKRCGEPELQFATDEDTTGPDPLARRYDFGKNPLDYATEQMALVKLYREKLVDRFVEDGDSWDKARRGYELTLAFQTRSASMMSNWIGGSFLNRDKKGDPGDRAPVEVVPAQQQRDALQFVIETTFRDDAYGLSADILRRLGGPKWLDQTRFSASQAAWPIHDRILGIQSSALTWLMNPTTLRRVYDNELRLSSDEDALTLPELLGTIDKSVWSELENECDEDCSDREPMISSLRRNLQREHMQRLIDLVLEPSKRAAASKPISNLARMGLRSLSGRIEKSISKCGDKMDAYTLAHLTETKERIDRVLEAGYTYGSRNQGGQQIIMMIGEQAQQN